MKKTKYYISSFRLRTLPLSVSGIILGSFIAKSDGYFNTAVFCLALLTTLCLQILSNLANELGDMQKGTDNANRLGPVRALQSGILTTGDFKRLITGFALSAMTIGTVLIFTAFHSLLDYKSILMLFVGGMAAIAAVKYTIGKNPYGYRGLGDIFVFLFFGWVSTAGAYYLMAHQLTFYIFLPATSIGLLTTGVLNVNNTRDRENDAHCGKHTIPVLIGEKKAKTYHFLLITGGIVCMLLYTLLTYTHLINWGYIVLLPLFILHLQKIHRYSGKQLDPQLKFLSVITLLWALMAGILAIY